ncbi:MAG: DUF6359 domain-containing protein [Firmicutes bacterium]|nr:DUF6359 domain-containing protein [Bacillota bacterium]MCM1401066.1 DUF6359 domain-containing protein [Bacteroides sp.]MCM1476985.1 DUF6359 domain-containing protein [Bacteroides sp.]
MKYFKANIAMFLAVVAMALGFAACGDGFDAPELNAPVANIKANTTIAELKQLYWNSADNYIDTIKVAQNGNHIIIGGRVISSDASGNIYKSLVIQDETGALAMSINANSLYVNYRIGQEIVIDLTDMYIGKYSTLQQLGFPDYSAGYGWQATFMPLEFFKEHAQLNGLPRPELVDTLTISIADLGNSSENLMRYQSQLVRFNNVYFEEGGEASFCTAHKVNTNRNLKDDNGNTIIVRTSGYANYWSTKLPEGHGDVVGILSTYKSGSNTVWQLLMRSTDDLLNFGNPTLPKGTETNPYSVDEAIDMVKNDKAVSAWFTGYIVGSLKAGVTTVESADDIIWGADAEVNNTLIIGQNAESNSLDQVMLIRLPQDSPLRQYGNLRDVPENYLKQIWVLATPGTDLGMNAFTGNSGAANEFRIEGVTVPGGDTPTPGSTIPTGDGSEASPYNPTQVVGMGTSANEANKWVKGYIVGWVDNSSQNYADENNCHFSVPATVATNILIASSPDVKDYSKCCVVNLPNSNDIRAKLNLVDNPSNLGQVVEVYGTIRKYFNIPGVRDLTNFKFEGSGGGTVTPTPTPGGDAIATGQGTEASPYNPTQVVALGTNANETNKWVKGYIVGWVDNSSQNYADANNCNFSVPATVATNVLIATTPDVKDYSQCVVVNLPNSNDIRAKVNLVDNPGNLGKIATFAGGVRKYFNMPGFRDVTAATVEGGSSGGGTVTPDPTPTPGGDAINVTSADLNTLTANSSYKSGITTADGWVLNNCAVQSGSTSGDSNPAFAFIGSPETRAACLNGKVGAEGTLTSPLIAGGIKTLSLKYGFAFTETKCKFTINIKQNGSVVATKSVTLDTITKLTAFDFSWTDINVSGDFVIEIVNDAYSQTASGNKDRVSIWNISWTR